MVNRRRWFPLVAAWASPGVLVLALVWFWPRPFFGQPLHSAVVRRDLAATKRWAIPMWVNDQLFYPIPDRRVGYTPLMLAAGVGDAAIAQVLIDNGADVNAGCRGVTPLMIAAKVGATDVMDLLLKHGAEVNAISDGRETALHFAARGGHATAIRRLLEHGFDRNLVSLANVYNRTALDECLGYPGQYVSPEVVRAFSLTPAELRAALGGGMPSLLRNPPDDWPPEVVALLRSILDSEAGDATA